MIPESALNILPALVRAFLIERKNIMIFTNRWYAVATVLVVYLLVSVGTAVAQKAPADKVADVNGKTISRTDLDREVKLWTDRMASQGRQLPPAQVPAVRDQILDSLINQELLFQASKKNKIKVDQKTIEERYGSIKQRFKTEEEFKEAIAKMDVTETTIRTQLEKGLAIDELLKTKVVKDIAVTEEESRKYYDEHQDQFKEAAQVKASHILIKVEPDATDEQKAEARKKIDAVQGKLKKGDDFAAVAKEYSEGPSNSRGGDLGFFQRGQMVKPFEEVAFSMDVEQVSGVVETQFGYHIIKVYEKKPESTATYSEVKDQLQEHLKQQKTREAVGQYVDGLRKKAKIEKF
jgi:peptidyl-prolyl cis-trans isomerase C